MLLDSPATMRDDLLNYFSKEILASPTFDEHPVIQQRLACAVKGELTTGEALTGFDREVLAQAVLMAESAASGASRS